VDAVNRANLDRFPSFKEILINAGFHTVVAPLEDMLVKEVRGALYLLWGGAAFVLLIGAVNVANLVLARATLRRKEFATRPALGAGTGRLMRQLVTESILVALAGGAAGPYWVPDCCKLWRTAGSKRCRAPERSAWMAWSHWRCWRRRHWSGSSSG